MKPALLLDRDGTVTVEQGYLTDPAALRLVPGAASAIRRARAVGFRVVLVTNQSAIARGLLDEAGLRRIHERLAAMLADHGTHLDGVFHCPHHPDHGRRVVCPCRKPAPGLLLEAAATLRLDLARSYTVGDRQRDVEAGVAAGTRTVGVRTGHGADEFGYPTGRADHVAADLAAAVEWVLEDRDVTHRGRLDRERRTGEGRPAP